MNMQHLIGLKELRQNVAKYARKVQSGHSFVVMKHSKPLFKITPVDEEERWEEAVDFTQIRKGGVDIDDLLKRL
jgi:prevent-host-death family protein